MRSLISLIALLVKTLLSWKYTKTNTCTVFLLVCIDWYSSWHYEVTATLISLQVLCIWMLTAPRTLCVFMSKALLAYIGACVSYIWGCALWLAVDLCVIWTMLYHWCSLCMRFCICVSFFLFFSPVLSLFVIICRWRPSVHVSPVCIWLEQLCASRRRAPAVTRPGGHLPGAALAQQLLCGSLLWQCGENPCCFILLFSN